MRVDVRAVMPAGSQQVDPQAVELRLAGSSNAHSCANLAACFVSSFASRRTQDRGAAGRSARRSWCSRHNDAPSTSAAPPVVFCEVRIECASSLSRASSAISVSYSWVANKERVILFLQPRATSLMKRASSPLASQSASAAIAASMSDSAPSPPWRNCRARGE